MIKYTENQKGSALLIAICLTMMLALIGIMAVKNSDTDIDLSFYKVHSEKAFYIAEAGVKRAFVVLNDTNSWRAGFDTVSFGNGTYDVNLVDSAINVALFDTVLVQATGLFDDAVSEVELTTVPEYIHPFAYGLFGEAGIVFDKNTCTDSYNSDSGTYAATVLDSLGGIGSNGTVTSSKDVNFGGDVSVATPGGIDLGLFNTVNGDTSSTVDSVELDIIPQSEFDYANANNTAPGGLSGANYTYDPVTKSLITGSTGNVVLTSGVYYFSDITLGQSSTFTLAPGAAVTIYVTGDIILGQSSTVNDGGSPLDLMIFSQGSKLQFDQDNIFYGSFYGPDADIQYDQTTEAYGSLVGGTIQLDAGACFHYDRSLSKITKGTTGEIILVAWREL